MGKFRSKLKKNASGKKWARGHSSTSNPESNKHRSKAKARFFQTNLSLGKYSSLIFRITRCSRYSNINYHIFSYTSK